MGWLSDTTVKSKGTGLTATEGVLTLQLLNFGLFLVIDVIRKTRNPRIDPENRTRDLLISYASRYFSTTFFFRFPDKSENKCMNIISLYIMLLRFSDLYD